MTDIVIRDKDDEDLVTEEQLRKEPWSILATANGMWWLALDAEPDADASMRRVRVSRLYNLFIEQVQTPQGSGVNVVVSPPFTFAFSRTTFPRGELWWDVRIWCADLSGAERTLLAGLVNKAEDKRVAIWAAQSGITLASPNDLPRGRPQ